MRIDATGQSFVWGRPNWGVNCIDDGVRTIYGGNFDKTCSLTSLSNYGFVHGEPALDFH